MNMIHTAQAYLDCISAAVLQSPDDTLEFLYAIIDSYVISKEFEFVDTLLSIANPNKLGVDVSLGLLVITNRAKKDLHNRNRFFEFVRKEFVEIFGNERANAILTGLSN